MSLDDEYRDVDFGFWDEDERLADAYENQHFERIGTAIRERRALIAKLDQQNSWDLVAKFLAASEEEQVSSASKEEVLDQECKEFLAHRLRLPRNMKDYLLYQLLEIRDLGVGVLIVAFAFAIACVAFKFVTHLTHS